MNKVNKLLIEFSYIIIIFYFVVFVLSVFAKDFLVSTLGLRFSIAVVVTTFSIFLFIVKDISKKLYMNTNKLGIVSEKLDDQSSKLENLSKKVVEQQKISSRNKSELEKIRVKMPNLRSELIEGGIRTVQPYIKQKIKNVKKDTELVVLGLTLSSAWPFVKDYINGGHMNNWKVSLCLLNPSYIKSANEISRGWSEESSISIDKINEYKNNNNNIEINIIRYEVLPVVHGFKVGKDNYFISFSHWKTSGQIDEPDYSYEFIDEQDNSARAKSMRTLFNNWLQKAGYDVVDS